MKNILFLFISLLVSNFTNAQQITCSTQDKESFKKKIEQLSNIDDTTVNNMTTIGKSFLKTPYVAKTLEIGKTETLVINFQGLDCTTFVENVLAFNKLLKDKKNDFNSFANTLKTIRYKNGELDGYASRLHYFSEWIANNEQKGLIRDVTSEIWGMEISKEINFMTSHRDLYPYLKDEVNFQKIKDSENYLNNQPMCILPQEKIEANEALIKSGDIIALTTSINGLDITHTGIATREKDGRIHLLHASSSGEVKITKEPLVDYLKNINKNTGIMVARVN